MPITADDLGLTQEELQQRVIDQLCQQFASTISVDDEGEEWRNQSPFARALDQRVKEHIEATIASIATMHVLPRVSEYIETITLQKTNEWGEPRGGGVTFREYLVQRAEHYMTEKVDWEGRSKDESRGSFFGGKQTRITHMIDKYLHHHLEQAMKGALEVVNGALATGILETIKIKLAEVTKALRVNVETR